jgi:hypothetical protein
MHSSVNAIVTATSLGIPVEAMARMLSTGWETNEGTSIFTHIVIIRKNLAPADWKSHHSTSYATYP